MAGEKRSHQSRATLAITAIKACHTLIFLGLASCVLYIFYSGITGRISRLTKVSFVVVFCGIVIFVGNGARCPLTVLAENLGSAHGAVGDIFLPAWFAKRIPLISTTMLAISGAMLIVHRLVDARRAQHEAQPATE